MPFDLNAMAATLVRFSGTLSDDNETVEVTLTVTADTAVSAEYEGVTYVQAPAAPGTVGTETSPGTTTAASSAA